MAKKNWTEQRRKFGEELWRRRKASNLTQSELGDLVGVEKQQISCMECGSCSPSIFIYARLCVALGFQQPPMLSGV